jgi:hypothetical protein
MSGPLARRWATGRGAPALREERADSSSEELSADEHSAGEDGRSAGSGADAGAAAQSAALPAANWGASLASASAIGGADSAALPAPNWGGTGGGSGRCRVGTGSSRVLAARERDESVESWRERADTAASANTAGSGYDREPGQIGEAFCTGDGSDGGRRGSLASLASHAAGAQYVSPRGRTGTAADEEASRRGSNLSSFNLAASPRSPSGRHLRRPSWRSVGSSLSGNDRRRRGSEFSSTSSAGAREEAQREADEACAEVVSRLSQVATRRTLRQETKAELLDRLKAALASGDPLVVVYCLLCELADAVLTKFQFVLEQSRTWAALTGGGYSPGSASAQGSPAKNKWLDLFVQIVCGWPDASVAFGPVQVAAASLLARELGLQGQIELMGTMRFVNSPHALPEGPITARIVLLAKAAVELASPAQGQAQAQAQAQGQLQPQPQPQPLVNDNDNDGGPVSEVLVRRAGNPMVLFKLKATVAAALGLIERVQLGDGGTPKVPSEFQLKYVQRVNEAVLATIDLLVEALRALK